MRVNAELKAAKYSKKYLAEHEADIAVYRAAQNTFRRLLSGAKLPKMDTLKAEFQRLSADKKRAYQEYRETKKGATHRLRTNLARSRRVWGRHSPTSNF